MPSHFRRPVATEFAGWRACGWRLALATLLLPSAAGATTYSIVTLVDGAVDDGNCTLREALLAVESDVAVDLCPAGSASDEIVLALAGTYLFGQGHQELTGETSQVSIRGADPTLWQSYIIDLEGANRFLKIDQGVQISLRDLVVRNGDVRQDPVNGEGGAIYIGDASATIENVSIESSKADSGGGLAFHGNSLGSLALRRVNFLSNEVEAPVAFTVAYGGGLSVIRFDADSTALLRDVSFEGNRARAEVENSNASGAGLSLLLRNAGNGDLQRLEFAGNQLVGGGGGDLSGAALKVALDDYEGNPVYPNLILRDVLVESSALVGATDTSLGLAISLDILYGATATLDRIQLRDNGIDTEAAEIHVFSQSGSSTLSNILTVDGSSRGIDVDQQGGGSVLLGNITSAGHPSAELQLSNSGPGTVRLENSIAWGDGVDDVVLDGTIDLAAENLLGVDPQFVDPGTGDYELLPSSPAVDAGDGSFVSAGPLDALHRPRLAGLEIDLGALELGGLFGDGFESADTGAWDTTQP